MNTFKNDVYGCESLRGCVHVGTDARGGQRHHPNLLGAGMTGGPELPDVGAGSSTRAAHALTAEPSLQHIPFKCLQC